MFEGMLQNTHPELADKIKEAMVIYTQKTEKKARAPEGSYWYREFRPAENGVGGTADQYYATLTDTTEVQLCGGTAITVPTGAAYVSFGWYVRCDLGVDGYLLTKKNNVTKDEKYGRLPYVQDDPKYMLLDFKKVFFAQEQEKLEFITYNAFGANQVDVSIPVMFIIASKALLNLEDL